MLISFESSDKPLKEHVHCKSVAVSRFKLMFIEPYAHCEIYSQERSGLHKIPTNTVYEAKKYLFDRWF